MAPAKAARQTTGSTARTSTGQCSAQGGTFPPIRPHEAERLDPWFEGVSQPSQRIQEMARRKRLKHDALLRQLRQELFRERSAAERTVAFISSNLRTELDKASLMVKLKGKELAERCERLCAETTGLQGECDGAAFKEAVDAACDVVRQLTEQRTRAVDAFYDLLLDVEAEHQKRAKDAFRKYGDALQRNGHLAPQRIQPVLDAEMKEVSELHLRHVISFGDLRLCLNMHAERDSRKFGEALDRSRRVHRERCQRATVSGLQKAANKSNDEHVRSTLMGRESLQDFCARLEQVKTSLVITHTYPFSSDDMDRWEIGVENSLQKLDDCAERICSALKGALAQMQMNSLDEIERLKEFLIGSDLCSKDNFETLYDNVCLPLLKTTEKKIDNDPAVLWKEWKQMFARVNSRIVSLTCFLKDARELWENFCQLQETGREQILLSLQTKMQDRGKHVEAKERRITCIMESSCQETKRKVVEDNVTRIFRILDEVKVSYESMHKQEREIIEGYTSSITHEVESLNSSKLLFLETHDRFITHDKNSSDKHGMEILNKSQELLVHIEQEEKRWHDVIGPFLEKQCESGVHQSGQNWIEQQVEKLREEYDCIAESHKLRYNQIQSQVQFARLAEISEHEKIFKNHKEVITSISINVQKELENTFTKMFQIFQGLSSQIKSLKENGLNNSSAESVKAIVNQVQTSYEQCKKSVQCLSDEFHTVVMQQMQKMKNNNQIFVESLKQFSDGGNYAESEIKTIQSEIRTLELDVEANVIKGGLSLKQKGKECCKEALKYLKICLRDLQVHLDNLTLTEHISSVIEKTQAQLNKHVLALKFGGKLLYEQTNKLVESCVQRDIAEVTNEWRCVTETILKRQKWLLSNQASYKEHRNIIPLSSTSLVDYGESNAFLPIIHSLLMESQRQIKVAVEDFHQRKDCHKFLNTNVLHDEVAVYMSEIGSKYKAYQEQCIEVWMCEVKGLLDSINVMNSYFDTYCNKTTSGAYGQLLDSLQVERNQLNENLMKLRASYQQHQVDTMAKLGTTQRYQGNQFSDLCSQFEATSGVLSENIKNLIDLYMEKSDKYLQDFEEKTMEHHNIIVETMEHLSGEFSENTILEIKQEVLHISKYYCFDLPPSTVLFFKDSENPYQGTKYRKTTTSAFLSAMENLCTAADQFWARYKQVGTVTTHWKPELLQHAVERSLHEARKLVHSKTSEVKKLYEQYKTMAEELKIKWRSTAENIRWINLPICSLTENE